MSQVWSWRELSSLVVARARPHITSHAQSMRSAVIVVERHRGTSVGTCTCSVGTCTALLSWRLTSLLCSRLGGVEVWARPKHFLRSPPAQAGADCRSTVVEHASLDSIPQPARTPPPPPPRRRLPGAKNTNREFPVPERRALRARYPTGFPCRLRHALPHRVARRALNGRNGEQRRGWSTDERSGTGYG